MKSEVFLDTNFAVAVVMPSDQLHALAAPLAKQLAAAKTKMVTTMAVLLEIGNALSSFRYRTAAVELLSSLGHDPLVEIVPLTTELYLAALELYQRRQDKVWGLTDCISFVVMEDRGIQEALTSDQHFEQAGFKALLRSKDEFNL